MHIIDLCCVNTIRIRITVNDNLYNSCVNAVFTAVWILMWKYVLTSCYVCKFVPLSWGSNPFHIFPVLFPCQHFLFHLCSLNDFNCKSHVAKETVKMFEYGSNYSESIKVLYLNYTCIIHSSVCINLKQFGWSIWLCGIVTWTVYAVERFIQHFVKECAGENCRA
jgi:hypothetical protein